MKLIESPVIEKIQNFILPEYFIIMWVVLAIGYIFYKISLKKITLKRHKNLLQRFQSMIQILSFTSIFSFMNWYFIYDVVMQLEKSSISFKLYLIGLVAILFFTATAFVKLAQIIAYLYLFYQNMSVGIPRLIANLFTFGLSVAVTIYLMSEVFSINLTTMVATSAVFSIVLGLALQDTLGNLFSGVALQIGNPFSIGDWIEVQNGANKWVGQVQEITWRATFLTSFSNEWIMIPNKVMSQSQILMYSYNLKQVRHSLTYRINFGSDFLKIKNILLEVVSKNKDVCNDPQAKVLLIESTESWITVKLFYSINDFSKKYSIADALLIDTLNDLEANGVKLAMDRVQIEKRDL